jgi:hypothetical protein
MFSCPSQKHPLAHSTPVKFRVVTSHCPQRPFYRCTIQWSIGAETFCYNTHTHSAENGVGDIGRAGVYFALCGDQQATGHATEEECFEIYQALKLFLFQQCTTMIGGPYSLPSNSYRVLFPKDKAAGA